MDLPPIQHQQSASVQPQQGAKSALLDTTQLPAGTKLVAKVDSVTPLPPSLLNKLDTLVKQSVGQSNSTVNAQGGPTNARSTNSTPAATPTTTQQLPQQNAQALQKLLTQTNLYAVQLSIQGKRAITVTNVELRAKQQVPLIVRKDGQLTIAATKGAIKGAISATTNSLSQRNSNSALTSSNTPQQITYPATKNIASKQLTLREGGNITAQNTTPQTSQLQRGVELTHKLYTNSSQKSSIASDQNVNLQTLGNGLRQYLPKQGNIAASYSILNTLNNLHNAATQNGKANTPLSPIIEKLAHLLKQTPTLDTLTTPSSLKTTLRNSGAFLEQNFFQLNRNSQQQGINNNTSATQSTNKENPILDDSKAELLRTIQTLLTPQPTSQDKNTLQNSAINKLLQSLLAVISPQHQKQTLTTEQSHKLLTSKLQPLLFSALARITTLQIQHLMRTQQEGSNPSGGFFEFPVRINDHFFPLTLSIQEHAYEEQHKEQDQEQNTQNEPKNKKRWHVFMEFDLDELGMFACKIYVDELNVKTTLWIQKQRLWEQSQKHLADLKTEIEASGITLQEIHCIQGKPPEQPMQVNYSLVDITT